MKKLLAVLILMNLMLSASTSYSAQATKAFDFNEVDLKGNAHSLEKYQGQPLVLYFWASWCPACVQEAGDVKRVYEKYSSKGIGFVTVSLDTDRQRLDDFMRERNLPYPVIFLGEAWENKLARLYHVTSTPSYYVIDKNGYFYSTGSRARTLDHQLKTMVQ